MRYQLTMPDELMERLREESRRTGSPVAELIRRAVGVAYSVPGVFPMATGTEPAVVWGKSFPIPVEEGTKGLPRGSPVDLPQTIKKDGGLDFSKCTHETSNCKRINSPICEPCKKTNAKSIAE